MRTFVSNYSPVTKLKWEPINRSFSWVEIEYLWGIESSEQHTSITWSCTLVELKDTQWKSVTIVIDAWMHQGWEKDNELNKKIDPRILDADYIIVTHAHIDHIGRLPQIVREWFTWKIIMSPITWDLAHLSLIDSARVMKRAADEAIEYNKKLGRKLQQLVKYRTQSIKKESWITRWRWGNRKNVEEKGVTNQEYIEKLVEQYPDVRNHTDIRSYLKEIPEPLFTEDDVHQLNQYITTLESEPWVVQQLALQQWIKSDNKQRPQIDRVQLEFLDAGHIIWSVQALISIAVKQIISNPYERLEEGQNVKESTRRLLFSWDLWRNEWYSWNLEWTSKELSYAQVESTYAWRPEHTSRLQARNNLFTTLQDCEGDVIIPAFALQRSQEILLLLLDYYEEIIYPQIQALKETVKWKSKEEKRKIWEEINKLDREIILDSPLAISMTKIFIQKAGKYFYPLSEEAQKKRFWKVVIRMQSEKLYKWTWTEEKKWDSEHIKRIIVAPSWMCEWGSVIAHLKEHLWRHTSSIVFVWYTPPQSLWWHIKTEKVVLIEGEVYPIHATIHNLDWFSWHISHQGIVDIVDNISLRAGGVIALTHGWDNRLRISADVEHKKVSKIKVPDLWDKISIKF